MELSNFLPVIPSAPVASKSSNRGTYGRRTFGLGAKLTPIPGPAATLDTNPEIAAVSKVATTAMQHRGYVRLAPPAHSLDANPTKLTLPPIVKKKSVHWGENQAVVFKKEEAPIYVNLDAHPKQEVETLTAYYNAGIRTDAAGRKKAFR